MNENVLEMVDTLKARLGDLVAVVGECSIELEGYDVKLDQIDTQVYVLQTKIEKLNERIAAGEEVTSDLAAGEAKSSRIPEDIKEGMTDAVQMAGNLARDAKPIVSEITGTVNELKEAFGISGKGSKTPFNK